MEQDFLILGVLILLLIGVILVFFARSIAKKIKKIKNENFIVTVLKSTGFLVSMLALLATYFIYK